jgi:DNA replication protein DnaC
MFLRKNVPQQAADDLVEIILNRYTARKSSLLTSNLLCGAPHKRFNAVNIVMRCQ